MELCFVCVSDCDVGFYEVLSEVGYGSEFMI